MSLTFKVRSTIKTGWIRWAFLLVLIINLCSTVRAQAQTSATNWSQPILFFEVETGPNSGNVHSPSLMVDSGGNLHALWSAQQNKTQPYALYYSRWNGETWSEPVDVLLSPDGNPITPFLIFDQDDWLHAFWSSSSGGFWHSQAHASSLGISQSWSRPEEIFGDDRISAADQFSVYLNPEGKFHFVYSTGFNTIRYGLLDVESKRLINSAIVYIDVNPETRIGYPSVVQNADGGIWASWVEMDPTYRAKGVIYTRSMDNGQTWDEPVIMSEGYYRGWFSSLDGTLFKIYVGGVGTGGRYISVSQDGGMLWTNEVNLSAMDNRGDGMQAVAIAQDSSGVYHFLEQTDNTFALATWNGEDWSEPDYIFSDVELFDRFGKTENAVMKISNGNRMHIFWEAGGEEVNQQLWYIQSSLNSPHIESNPIPPASKNDTSSPLVTETTTTDLIVTPTPISLQNPSEINSIEQWSPLAPYQNYLTIVITFGSVIAVFLIAFLLRHFASNNKKLN